MDDGAGGTTKDEDDFVAGRWNVRSAMAQAGGCATVEDGLPRRRLATTRGRFSPGALIRLLPKRDAAGAGGAGEDAFTGRFVLEIGVGRDTADGDL